MVNRSGRVAALAIDGGNSKTHVALVGPDGAVLGFSRSGGTSHEWLGVEASILALSRVIAAAAADAGLPSDAPLAEVGVFCLAGIDLPIDERVVGGAIERERWATRTSVRNDAFAMLRAGTDRTWGIGVVCGAGMNCVGISPSGDAVRFPALGAISGDLAAGGHWIGTRALGMAMRATDGRGGSTVLEQLVPEHFGLAEPLAVLEALRVGDLDEGMLADLSPVVFQAAGMQDAVAMALLDEVAAEIVIMVKAVARRLDLLDLDPDVVLGGGVFRSRSSWFIDKISSAIAEFIPAATITLLDTPPIVGAALLSLDELEAEEGQRQRLRTELTEQRISAAPLIAATTSEASAGMPTAAG